MTWITDLGLPPIQHTLPELETALRAADLATQEVMRIYNSNDIDVSTKADNSPVTKADISCNRIITKELSKTPHLVLSEEDTDNKSRLDANMVWIVDPLDGTADFVERTGEFTIMIALVQSNRPILGIIVQPVKRTIFVAQDGAGAYKGTEKTWNRVRTSSDVNIDECRLVCSRNHLSETDKKVFARLGITDMTKLGSSIKACHVASGDADLYVTTTDKMKEWDTCASWCIITEAGGRITDALGEELSYNSESVLHKHGIIASSGGRIHELATKECCVVLDKLS